MVMLVFGPGDETRVAEALDKRLATIAGGCWRPEHIAKDGECADRECWCAKMTDRLARDAINAIQAG